MPEPVAGSWLEGRKLCFQMETKGGIFILADEDIWKFEGEKYYHKTTDGELRQICSRGRTLPSSTG